MSKTKVVLRYATWRAKANETIEVDAETAERLVAQRHASPVKPGPEPKEPKG
jgi:hypothetical protein